MPGMPTCLRSTSEERQRLRTSTFRKVALSKRSKIDHFPKVTIHRGAVVRNSVVMSSTTVEEGAEVHYSIVAEGVNIGRNACVGGPSEPVDHPRISVVADHIRIGNEARIEAGTVVDRDR